MEKQFKNYKTFEEAKEVWDSSVQKLRSDHVVFYIEPREEKEVKMIGIENADDEAEVSMTFKVLAVGEKVEDITPNQEVVIHPSSERLVFPIFLKDCLFTAMSSNMIVATLK